MLNCGFLPPGGLLPLHPLVATCATTRTSFFFKRQQHKVVVPRIWLTGEVFAMQSMQGSLQGGVGLQPPLTGWIYVGYNICH